MLKQDVQQNFDKIELHRRLCFTIEELTGFPVLVYFVKIGGSLIKWGIQVSFPAGQRIVRETLCDRGFEGAWEELTDYLERHDYMKQNLQVDDLVYATKGDYEGQFGLFAGCSHTCPSWIDFRPIPGDPTHIITSSAVRKITPLTIEDLRSHNFTTPLDAYMAWPDKIEAYSILSWEHVETSFGSNFRMWLRFKGAERDIDSMEILKSLKNFYFSKDDAIVASAWMLREQQAERRKQIADLEQQEREMLAGLGLS